MDVFETDIIRISDEGIADIRQADRKRLLDIAAPDVHERDRAGITEVGGVGGVEKVGILEKVSLAVDIPALPRFPDIPGPVFPVIIIPSYDEVQAAQYVDGKEQRIDGVAESTNRIRLRYQYLSESEKTSIYSFFIARKGRSETFYWVNPLREIAYIVRFEEDILNQEYFAHKLWNFNEVSFIETYWRAS